ncbi:MAG: isocitrate lyase/PEP mutase family protein [Deltaproteobacteria bacterium]|nr:isocitrate lyase/PEP mutase family protein [Deltaproteobacteria bacterium]
MPKSLRERLTQQEILIAPGAYDAFIASLIEKSGFEAVYMSGAGVSYSTLGRPDMGILTQTEMVARVEMISRAVSVPVIADGDTGYGNAVNVVRTVHLYERAGASAIQLEDQQFPKRCGHLSGKELVSTEEMVGKIRAAVDARDSDDFLIIARTDARSVTGLDEALLRARKYADAGADVIFVESPHNAEDLEAVAEALGDVPLIANMVEGGKTPLLTADELQEMGYSLVIYPNSITRRFARVALDLLAELKTKGTTHHMRDKMIPFKELNRMLGIDNYRELEKKFLS